MKKNYYLILSLVMTLSLFIFSCSKEDDSESNDKSKVSVTGSATNVTYTTADLSAWYNPNELAAQGFEIGVLISADATCTKENGKMYQSYNLDNDQKYMVTVSNLRHNTTYYYRSYARQGSIYTYGNIRSFTTKELMCSVTCSASNITYNSADVSCGFSPADVSSLFLSGATCAILISTDANCSIDNSQVLKFDLLDDTYTYIVPIRYVCPKTTYYYRTRVLLDNENYAYSDILSFATKEYKMPTNFSYVDLGLSVKWAICNVGAENPEDYGDYFAWGETAGFNSGKTNFEWGTYKWCNGTYDTQTKYCTSSCGIIDFKSILEATDDAATKNWGDNWRMPTYDEIQELYDNCTWTWTQLNGINGNQVTSNKTGYTDKSIFLPAAGYRIDTHLSGAGSLGFYWSNTLSSSGGYGAWSMYLSMGRSISGDLRYYGFSVRPVRAE